MVKIFSKNCETQGSGTDALLESSDEISPCDSGGVDEKSCSPCPAGYYCSETGLSAVSGECDAGFYCPAGSTTSKQQACSAGHYCPKVTKE